MYSDGLYREYRVLTLKQLILIVICFGVSNVILAADECADFDAKLASDKSAESYVKGKTFKRALILKRHLPSKRKEVASYVFVKGTGLYYTVYSLVNSDCDAEVIKRTNGKY